MQKTNQPSCVLICGNTKLLDLDTLKNISQYYNVVLSGDNDLIEEKHKRFSKKLHIYKEDILSEKFAKIAFSYKPAVVWYISGYADGQNGLDNEKKNIERLFNICVVNEVSKLIYVSSVNSLNFTYSDNLSKKKYESRKAFSCAQMEDFVNFLSDACGIKRVTIRVPYIFSKNNKDNYIGHVFNDMLNDKKIVFPYREDQYADFISISNFAELMISISEEVLDEADEYTLTGGFANTYGMLADKLIACKNEQEIQYKEEFYDLVLNNKAEEKKIRKNYGFVPTENIIEEIGVLYANYISSNSKENAFREKLKKISVLLSGNIMKLLEVVLFFAILQLLLNFTSDSVYFKYVDLRLFFIIIIGISHGMIFGTIAGVLSCVSLVLSFLDMDVTGTMLFYNTDYWLPFSIYLITGAVVGYITSAKNRKIDFAEEEISALQEKYLFLNNVYMSVIDNKEDYKRQILGYQDSFGKIFDAVDKLNSSLPTDIFMNGVNTLENILENHSIAIYTMDDNQKYARLVACSREMTMVLRKSLNIGEQSELYETILNRETWKNSEFKENLPSYAYAIVEKEKVRLIICIYEAKPEQLSLYYMNLFTIMCHLIRVSFRRALEYQNAIEDEKYYADTSILKPEYFDAELDTQRKMAEAGVASYILLKLGNKDIANAGRKLQGLIRHSDLVGEGNDGAYYLLLTQITEDIFTKIGERLETNGIIYSIAEGI